MELVFKLPEGKLPFIGIAFEESEIRQACTLNRDLIDLKETAQFSGSVVFGSLLEFRLVSDSPYNLRVYKGLKFKENDLKVFKHLTARQREFNFGHVLNKFDRHELVKTLPGRKNFVLKLSDFKFLVW